VGLINRSPTRAAALLATDELALKFLEKVLSGLWVSGGNASGSWWNGFDGVLSFVCFLTIAYRERETWAADVRNWIKFRF